MRRRITQTVMWELLELLSRGLAPIVPYTADEVYRELHGEDACVHLADPFKVSQVTADPGWAHVIETREQVLKAVEDAKARGIDNALDAEVVIPDPEGRLAAFDADLRDVMGVSRVRLVSGGTDIEVIDLREQPKCERCWHRDQSAVKRADGGTLCDRCADAVGTA